VISGSFVSRTTISLSGAGYGSGRNQTALMMLKITVFTPMPSANVRMAVNVKPGLVHSMREP
jgi:hypothetical protein